MVLSNLLLARILDQRALDRFSNHGDHPPSIRQDPKVIGKDASAVEEWESGAVGLFGKGIEFFDCGGLLGLIKEVVFAKGEDGLSRRCSRCVRELTTRSMFVNLRQDWRHFGAQS